MTSSAINTGNAWNTLRVRAVGSTLRFYINGTLVWVGSDTTFTAGRVGVGMYAGPGSTGNGFWLDDAKLTVLTPSGTLSLGQQSRGRQTSVTEEATVDAEQLSLNEAANRKPLGTIDEASEDPELDQANRQLQRGPNLQ